MKKIIAMLLAISMVLAFAACGKTPTTDPETKPEALIENVEDNDKIESPEAEEKPDAEEKPAENKPAENKPAEEKPAEEKPAENKPAEEKPAESKPTEDKKEETAKTVGNILLSAFKAQADKDALTIAENLANNSILPFSAGAIAVEPGLLSGFDNYEVKGFKSGAGFMPMMGSIAFVGYVFELEDGVKAADFIANLKKNANLRWNICVEAEEMVTGSVGNKVFFVMCPKQFEE